jgi:hypothetical protein
VGSLVGYHTARMIALLIALFFVQSPPSKKVEIVSVTGCLREQGANNWMLVAATDPVPSVANQAQGDEIRDRTMVIRGLLIRDKVSRINVTSAVEAVATCAPGAPK